MNVKGLILQYLNKEKRLKKHYILKITKAIQNVMFQSFEITKVSFVFLEQLNNENESFKIIEFETDAGVDDLEYENKIKQMIFDLIPLLAEVLNKSTTYFEINSSGPPKLVRNYVYKQKQ